MRRLLLLLLVIMPALVLALSGQAGPYHVELTTDPNVVPVGKATLDVYVTDSAGKPMDGATVRAIAQMPNMPMGEREQAATPAGTPGHYRMSQSFSMEGGYDARISVAGPLGNGTVVIPMETGKPTATTSGDSGASLLALWPWAIFLALVAFVLVRMRRSGQSVRLGALLNRQVIGALLVLAAVSAVALYAVNRLRRPGAMTPIEAQTMNMDMPPPEGVAAVTLATAELRPLARTISYSGQVVGFVEQDVTARTSGVIVWMPAYAGTRVRQGEVIARLDTSQLAPQVGQQSAMVESARAGVRVAQADYRQAQAMIHQAESELGQFQGAVAEAQANVVAARADLEAASAGVASAEADVRDVKASANSARADQQYWADEIKREANLFAAGAVSRDEYEKEKAEAAKSQAALRAAEEAVRSAESKVRAAEAGRRKSSANLIAAARKVDQVKSALMAHHAHVQTARAEAASAQQKITQSAAGVRQAQAGLQGAAAQAAYAEIRAQADGVVTQRIISPGSLVAPGQAILRIAQIEPIRIQANVPEADLAAVRIGAAVRIRHRDRAEAPIGARVSAVSPAVDPASRTGIVEAALPNADHAYFPGQFVSMEIQIGPSGSQVTIPSQAVQLAPSTGDAVQAQSTETFVWLARPVSGSPGRYTVERRSVVVGDAEGDRTAIRAGLQAGDQVVAVGGQSLTEGQTVAVAGGQMDLSVTKAIKSREATATAQVISITEEGFVPASLSLTGSGPRRVTFVRKTDNTCAKQVVFSGLGITKDLPLNKPVTIELPPSAKGELNYACGMNMLKGKVIVQ